MNSRYLVLAPLLLAGVAAAQRTQPGVPASVWAQLPAEIPTAVLPTPDVAQLMLEDEARGHRPLRYGEVLEAQYDCDEYGLWDEAPDGSFVWRMRLHSAGAFSLGVVFDEFVLSPGEQVFLYDEAQENVLGAYTELNNQPNGQLGVEPFPGDTLVVEFVRQSWVTTPAALSIGTVTHDYRNVTSPTHFVGGSCLIGINCPQGANYQDEKRGVFRTLANGSLCSAALINNTNNDGTPYFLTAEHCGNMTNGTFAFNFEATNCSTSGGSTSQSISGATLLAADSSRDSQLYRMNANVPSGYAPYFLGWNRTNSSIGGTIVTIGHGGGNAKNMAVANGASTSGFNDWIVDWTDGYIIGGNSGGPLLDPSGRVIGPACCVNNFTCGSQVAWYGRFGRFWNADNLEQWLAPTGTAPTTLDGYDPANGPGPGSLDLIAVTPAVIPCLIPGTDKTIVLSGTGFTPQTQVAVNGVTQATIPANVQYVSSTEMRLDMPQVDSLGFATISVTDGTASDMLGVLVQAPTTPQLQTGNGDAGNLILAFSGLDLKYAGTPGDLHLVVYSTSSAPSDAPGIVSLLLGANFTNVPQVGVFAIPARGWDELNLPVSSVGFILTIYSQSVNLGSSSPLNFPLETSNLQEFQML
ncbi:MAG: serine protease [Planctomycetota bacterium]